MHQLPPKEINVSHQTLTDLVTLPLQHSEDRLRGDTEVELSELQRSVERLQELLEEVLDQAGVEKMGQAQEVTDSLVAEIKVLKKRDTEMKDLARCEDNIHYLQVGWTSELSREGLTKGVLGYASVELKPFQGVTVTVRQHQLH